MFALKNYLTTSNFFQKLPLCRLLACDLPQWESLQCKLQCKVFFPANLSILSQSFYQKYFCDVASHIWNATCQESRRKKFLEIKYPKICDIIAPFSEYFDGKASCEKWPKNYFAKYRYVQNIGSHFEKVFNSVKNLSF